MTNAVVRLSRHQDEWDQLVNLWLHGRPESTQYVYRPVIADFRDWFRGTIAQVSLKDLQDYADRWKDQKLRTQNRKLATVKSFLAFCFDTGYIKFDCGRALRMLTVPDDLAERILSEEEIARMIEMEPDLQKRVVIRVLYGSGIRASEASKLRWLDTQSRAKKSGQITVYGKGRKTRSILLSTPVWQALEMIRPRDASPQTPVFVRQDGVHALDRTAITKIVGAAARRAGIPRNVSAHWMRHGHATHALDHGAKISLIQQCLGHSDIQTTAKYIHAHPDETSADYVNA